MLCCPSTIRGGPVKDLMTLRYSWLTVNKVGQFSSTQVHLLYRDLLLKDRCGKFPARSLETLGRMLIDLLDTPICAVEGLAVSDAAHPEEPLRAPGVGPEHRAQPALARHVRELQLDPLAPLQDGSFLVVDPVTVGLRGLGCTFRHALQDLALSHVAVIRQQELEQVIVALDRLPWVPILVHVRAGHNAMLMVLAG